MTAVEQNITEGEAILLQTIPLREEELLRHVIVMSVEQGNLQEAVQTLRAMVDQGRQFQQRDRVLWFILRIFAGLIAVSLAMLIVDAFQVLGFRLTDFVRNALVTSVVGEVAGLVAIVIRFLFPPPTGCGSCWAST